MSYVGTIIWIISIAIIINVYNKLTKKRHKIHTCLNGKTAVIIAADPEQVSFDAALDFAKRGARVILACGNKKKCTEVTSRIIKETGNQNIIARHIDLLSLQSIRDFADDINQTEERLDILINNIYVNRTKSNSLEILPQMNYYSIFLLINLLMKLLEKSAPSRIINVSSATARWPKSLNIIDLMDYYMLNMVSMLSQISFTQELSRRFKDSGVTSYCLHIGGFRMEMLRLMRNKVEQFMPKIVKDAVFESSSEGLETILYASLANGIENFSGGHFKKCEKVVFEGTVNDPIVAKRFWARSEEVVQIIRST